jgi:hypothetical protein
MDTPPIERKSTGLRPGRVTVRLGPEHRKAYEALYGQYRTIFDSLPVLRERDFDGRAVSMTKARLEVLSRALASLGTPEEPASASPFEAQDRARRRLFKRLQFLS